MKTSILMCAIALSVAAIGTAQETPQYEVFLGGSLLRVHASGTELTQLLDLSDTQYQPRNMNFTLYGWNAALIENLNGWFGGEFDASGFYGTLNAGFLFPARELVSTAPNFTNGAPVVTHYQTFLVGPRFTLRKHGPVTYFAHVLLGIAYVNPSLSESAIVATDFASLPSGTIKKASGFALAPGVGINWRLNEKITITPIQLDYLITHVYGERQDNARASAGLSFTFGKK